MLLLGRVFGRIYLLLPKSFIQIRGQNEDFILNTKIRNFDKESKIFLNKNLFMELIFILIGLFILIAIARPILVFVHELGHGIAALYLTDGKVTLYVGSHGDIRKSLYAKWGRLELYFRYNPFLWLGGLCNYEKYAKELSQEVIIVLLGPLVSLIMGISFCYLSFWADLHGALKLISMTLFALSIWDFIGDLTPQSRPVQLYDGTSLVNDGELIRQLLLFGNSYKEYTEGVNYYNEGEFGKASICFQKIIDSGKIINPLYQFAIYALMNAKDYLSANGIHKKLEENFLLNYHDYVNAAIIKMNLEFVEEGHAYFEKAIQMNPADPKAYGDRAYFFAKAQEYDKAILDYTKSIELSPNMKVGYEGRGWVYVQQMRYGLAISDFTKLIELAPDEKLGYEDRAWVSMQMGQFDRAIQDYTHRLKMNPNSSEILCCRAYVYVHMGNKELAFADYDKAIELSPSNLFIYSNKAYGYWVLKEPDNAIREFTKAITLEPDNAFNYANRGLIRIQKGEEAGGYAEILYALELNANEAYAHRNMGIYYFDKSQYKDALPYFEQADSLDRFIHLLPGYLAKTREELGKC